MYEPDPEERGGYYWSARFTDTRKVFGLVPSDIYRNAETERIGKKLTRDQRCTHNGACPRLGKQENIIGSMIFFHRSDFVFSTHQSNLGG